MRLMLQLSAAQGPTECCLAVAKALPVLLEEARAAGVNMQVLEKHPGPAPGTLRSILLSLDGENALALAHRWEGSLQWVCSSPYRPGHKRRNWFFGGQIFTPLTASQMGTVHMEAIRASGPGGQHVNKTSSAIRATHEESGIQVKVQGSRSQYENRQQALLLIAKRLAEKKNLAEQTHRASRRMAHHALERGSALRVFQGERFIPVVP